MKTSGSSDTEAEAEVKVSIDAMVIPFEEIENSELDLRNGKIYCRTPFYMILYLIRNSHMPKIAPLFRYPKYVRREK